MSGEDRRAADRMLEDIFGAEAVAKALATIDQKREAAKELILMAYEAELEQDPTKRMIASLPLAEAITKHAGANLPEPAFELLTVVIKCADEIALELGVAGDLLAEAQQKLAAAEGKA